MKEFFGISRHEDGEHVSLILNKMAKEPRMIIDIVDGFDAIIFKIADEDIDEFDKYYIPFLTGNKLMEFKEVKTDRKSIKTNPRPAEKIERRPLSIRTWDLDS